ncbi:probable serine/threonine-protein kinase DDB_G0275165 [Eurytemora carolleeae]|uniref:probable serine/threonine-protein kinase DDB_G0275165 n=1 Tax=Eurytemora carolleeae TaxID=1294199 RepID=UPI000C76B212|nr:probable serine/threonine-protein kinase DDB_G0275165 [Eurytemora carolleeae]|eukprot:XP_023341559.1 probable serine/threonine-protein kinase DDB_G0275165 [Eurytemora affinis]
MGMYWQPCTDSAECKTDDVNLECVVREDKEGFWCECQDGWDLVQGFCASQNKDLGFFSEENWSRIQVLGFLICLGSLLVILVGNPGRSRSTRSYHTLPLPYVQKRKLSGSPYKENKKNKNNRNKNKNNINNNNNNNNNSYNNNYKTSEKEQKNSLLAY